MTSSVYTVRESEGEVEVCAQLVEGDLGEMVALVNVLLTQDGTATLECEET